MSQLKQADMQAKIYIKNFVTIDQLLMKSKWAVSQDASAV